jgi:hypothetical protein
VLCLEELIQPAELREILPQVHLGASLVIKPYRPVHPIVRLSARVILIERSEPAIPETGERGGFLRVSDCFGPSLNAVH